LAFTAEVKKVVRIDRLVRPVKPANSDMGNALTDFTTVIRRHPNARSEVLKIFFV
jgi:hypothetical protein